MTKAFEILTQIPEIQKSQDNESLQVYMGFALDETGSMAKVLDRTISGFNEYLNTVKADTTEKNRANFTLATFNQRGVKFPYENIDVREVSEISRETYRPAHNTNLYDSIGQLIFKLEQQTMGINNPKVMITIMTDGEENCSTDYTREDINNLITAKQALGWNFVFLGANQAAWRAAQGVGIHVNNAATYAVGAEAATLRTVAVGQRNWRAGGGTKSKNFFTDFAPSAAAAAGLQVGQNSAEVQSDFPTTSNQSYQSVPRTAKPRSFTAVKGKKV